MMFRINLEKILFIGMAIIGVILTLNINNALALDQRLELSDLGSFNADGIWYWDIKDLDLLQNIAEDAVLGDRDTCNWSNDHPECTLLTPTKADEIIISIAILTNRRGPDQYSFSETPDSSVMLEGFVDGAYIPEIWKHINDYGTIWFEVIHKYKPEALADCEEYGWESPECAWWHEEPVPDIPRWDDGPSFYFSGTPLTEDNVQSITWVEGNKTAVVEKNAFEHGLYMSWDTSQNILKETGRGVTRTLYMESFGSQCPVGVHTFILTLKDERTTQFLREVFSDRLMPVVSATKKEKSIKGITVEKANMTASEIIDEDNAKRLLIQWAEPDLSMTFSEYKQPVRLRMWIGNGWVSIPESNHVGFLWIDVPITSGSVVIPPDAYEWVKQGVLKSGGSQLEISGQYREQYEGFHNRGYMGYIFFPINN